MKCPGSALNQVAEHGIAELGLEPGALGRHDAAGIGDAHQIFNARRKHGKCADVFAAVNELFQLRRAADATDEIDALARARISDPENGREHLLLQNGYVEPFNRITTGHELRFHPQPSPLALEIKTELVLAAERGRPARQFQRKNLVEPRQKLFG